MDLSANFAADFSKFTAACSQAEISLKGIESGAANVETKLAKMGDSLSGTKIIQQAAIMAEAVERIGGVSALTAKELQAMGAIGAEAAEKLRAQGAKVPENIQAIADAAAKARDELARTTQSGTEGFDKLVGSLKNVAGALGLAFGAGAVIGGIKNLIGGAIDMASAINDTSQKLGVSAEKWQGWVAAVELGGGTAEDVSKAVTTLNRNIVEGSKETQRAAHDLGLEWTDLRDMKIQDTFETVVTAMMKMPDQQVAIALGAKLMGKSVSEMQAAIKDDMVKTGASVQKMSDDTVAQLAAAGDAWESLSRTVVIVTGGIIAATTQMVTQASSSWKEFGLFVADAATGGVAFAIDQQQVRKAIQDTKQEVLIYGPTLEQLTRTVHKSVEETKADEDARKKATAALEAHRQAIQGVADLLTGRHVAQEVKDLQEALTEAQRQGGLTAEGWRVLDERLRKLIDAGAKLTPELQRVWEFHKNLNDIIPQVDTGLGNLARNFPDVTEKWRAGADAQDRYLMSLRAIVTVASGLPKDLLKIAPDVDLKKTGEAMEAAFKKAQEAHQRFVDAVSAEGFKLLDGLTHGWDSFKSAVMSVLDDLLVYFERKFVAGLVASMLGGTGQMGGMWSGLLSSGGSSAVGTAVSGGTAAGTGGTSAGTAAGVGSGASTALVAAGVAGGGFAAGYYGAKAIDAWMTNEGRNVVEWFAGVYGGFDKLHEKLSTLGAQGEQLWITLTQGTGNKSPQQAQATIHLIETAFQNATQAAQDATQAADDFAAAVAGAQSPEKQVTWIDNMLEVGKKLGLTFDDLSTDMKQIKENDAFKKLTDDINAAIRAGFDEQAVLKQSADDWQALLDHAKKYGLDVPESMKPTLQKLVDMGLLVDENGTKLDDLSSIHFAKIGPAAATAYSDMARHADRGFKDVSSYADRTAADIAEAARKASGEDWNTHTQPQPESASATTRSAANEGFFRVPTTVRVGDDPYGEGEFVLHKRTVDALLAAAPLTFAQSGGAGRRGGGGTVIVELDGRFLAQAVVPELEGEIRRLGFGR